MLARISVHVQISWGIDGPCALIVVKLYPCSRLLSFPYGLCCSWTLLVLYLCGFLSDIDFRRHQPLKLSKVTQRAHGGLSLSMPISSLMDFAPILFLSFDLDPLDVSEFHCHNKPA